MNDDLIQSLKDAFEKVSNKRAEWLLTNKCDDYIVGLRNGEFIYDTAAALDDAKRQIAEGLANEDFDLWLELAEDNKFSSTLGKFLKGLL